MAIAIFPVIVLVVGVLLWFISSNAKVQEAGRIMFFCGLLALCFALTGKTVRLL